MRVLLVQPPVYDFNAFDLWSRPLGWLKLAAFLRAAGAEVELADAMDRFSVAAADLPVRRHRLEPFGCGHYYHEVLPKPALLEFVPRFYKRFGLPVERFRGLLAERDRPDVIVIGCTMTYWYPGVLETVRWLRTLWPESPLIVAGIYAMLCPEHAQQTTGANWVFSGHEWCRLLEGIEELTGISFAKREPPGQEFLAPAYDLLSQKKSLALSTSSGCVYACSYCAAPRLQPLFQQYPVRALIRMLEACSERYGTEDWAFYDDALLVKKDRHIVPLLEEVVRRGLRFRFHVPNALHCRPIDRKMADLMRAAGFETVRLGLEFGQGERQARTGAKVTWEEYEHAVSQLFSAGFSSEQVGTYVMIGYPGQTMEEILETCSRVVASGSPIRLAMFGPIPGTRDFGLDYSDWRFHPSQDPLLHNCSLAPYRCPLFPPEGYQRLKRQVDDWNRFLTRTEPVAEKDSPP